MRVAVTQFAPKLGAYKDNVQVAARQVVEAAQKGAQLIVLPELCTTGYSFMASDQIEPFSEVVGQTITVGDSPSSLSAMRALVDKLAVAVVWGFVRRDPGTGLLYNSQIAMFPDGWLAYDKANLWGNDFLWATEGRSSPPIREYLGKKIGLLICRDIRDKSSSIKDFYEKGDADIVCFSSNFGDGGFPSVSWMNFVKENQTYLAVSNRYGQEMNNKFGEGGIGVIEPSGKVHCEGLLWNQPCIVYAEVP